MTRQGVAYSACAGLCFTDSNYGIAAGPIVPEIQLSEQGMLLRCAYSQGHLPQPSLSALWNKGCSQKMCFYATSVDQEAQWSHQTKSNDLALHNGHF